MRKPDLYVIARFLDVLWKERRGMRKTRLQMGVRLNYPAFLEYVKWLEKHGLIEILNENGSEKIKLTEKGIESYGKLVKWIRDIAKDIEI